MFKFCGSAGDLNGEVKGPHGQRKMVGFPHDLLLLTVKSDEAVFSDDSFFINSKF